MRCDVKLCLLDYSVVKERQGKPGIAAFKSMVISKKIEEATLLVCVWTMLGCFLIICL